MTAADAPDVVTASPERVEELRAALARTTDRVARAARAAGRDPDELRLVVVTKFFPVSDVRALAGLGVRAVGESRDQEAAAKVADLTSPTGGPVAQLAWHFIGQVQTNKAASVVRYADVVHSVDRLRLVRALDRAAGPAGRTVDCFVQVDLAAALGRSQDEGRGGAAGEEVHAVAEAVDAAANLRLRGLMAVAPQAVEPAAAFEALAALAGRVRADHPGAVDLSAGMSGDLEEAVAAGATHLRVGGAILGTRPAAR